MNMVLFLYSLNVQFFNGSLKLSYVFRKFDIVNSAVANLYPFCISHYSAYFTFNTYISFDQLERRLTETLARPLQRVW